MVKPLLKHKGEMETNLIFCLAWTVFRSVITHSVRSMYVCSMYVVFANLINVSPYIDVFPWDLDTMILG